MYIRIADIPESTMKPVMEEFQAELEELAEKRIKVFFDNKAKVSTMSRLFMFKPSFINLIGLIKFWSDFVK
jgi:hypothetical protein